LSLLAMSAMMLPAASWQGIVMRKKVRTSSVTTMARGEPLAYVQHYMPGWMIKSYKKIGKNTKFMPIICSERKGKMMT
jgi:hypothetical protein